MEIVTNTYKKNYSIIALIACLSFSIISALWALYSPELLHFKGRMISESTLAGFDIQQRISFFFKSVVVFVVSFYVLWTLYKRYQNLSIFRSAEFSSICYLSIFTLLLLVFSTLGFKVQLVLSTLVLFKILLLIGFFLRQLPLLKVVIPNIIDLYALSFVAGIIGFYFLSNGILIKQKIQFNTTVFSLSFVMLSFLFYNQKAQIKNIKFQKYAYILLPLGFIPFLPILKTETYLTLNNYGYYALSMNIIYWLWFAVLVSFIVMRYYNARRKTQFSSLKSYLSKGYFPILIFCWSCCLYYQAIIKVPNEMFELANEMLPIMELNHFGTIPILEKFNSHVLSEFGFSFIYYLVNGTSGYEMVVYNFFIFALYYLVIYYFFLNYFKHWYLSFLICMVFPLTAGAIPFFHAMGLIALFVLLKLLSKKQNYLSYLVFILGLFFVLVWRIDTGYASIAAIAVILLSFVLHKQTNLIKWKLFFKTAIGFIVMCIILLWVIGVIRNFSVTEKLSVILNYLSSAQTYGHVFLGSPSETLYTWHYFVFPAFCTFVLAYLLVNGKKYYQTPYQTNYLGLLFLVLYYLFNFQRGLVRHGFIENTDAFFASFIFLITVLSILLISKTKHVFYQTSIILGGLTFSVLFLQFPNTNISADTLSFGEAIRKKLRESNVISIPSHYSKKISRVEMDSNGVNTKYGKLISFFKTELKGQETFIDFANMPMLYFFTQKQTPSSFYQNPMTLHNDFLQTNFIENIGHYQTPFLLFGKVEEDFFDNVDGVPNTLRHYKLSEYFFKQYEPYLLINGFRIWKNKNYPANNLSQYPKDTIETQIRTFHLNKLPYIWGQYDDTTNYYKTLLPKEIDLKGFSVKADTLFDLLIPENENSKANNTLVLKIKSKQKEEINLQLSYFDEANKKLGEFTFTAMYSKNSENYAIRLGSQYNWWLNNVHHFQLHSNKIIKLTSAKLTSSE